jgi:flagellar hook-length control protein FliK
MPANPFAASTLTGQSDSSNATAAGNPAQADPAAQAGMANPLSAILGSGGQVNPGQVSAAVVNPAAPLTPGRISPRFAASRVADAAANPNVRGASTSAPTSIPASVRSAASDELPQVSQTPFSVFFSSPGPGTESAAATLPKMVLPVASSPIRDSHISGADAPGANSQTGGPQGGNGHNAAPQNAGVSTSGNESVNTQAVQPVHRDGDTSAAVAQLAAAQDAAVQAPAPASPAAATLLSAAPAAPIADSLPKTETPPAPAPGSSPAPVVPEILVAVVPGPVQTAQLVNRVDLSEMRIGMNTSAFGSVEVRTVVHANDVGLVIGSEKGDLRSLLQSDMPAIANTLQEQNLRLHTVNFMQGFAFSNNASGGGNSQPRPFVPARALSNTALQEAAVSDSTELLPAQGLVGGGLSILA